MKHKHNQDYILNGIIYKSINGLIDIPTRIESLNPIEDEIIDETKIDWKQLADDAGIKGEELKKFMKKNESQRQIQLDKLKEV